MSDLAKFDEWLGDEGPAALVIRETLEPVEGPDGVFFPATFAAAEDKTKFAGGYNIDTFSDGTNVCLVDSVGSQANRVEPLFARDEYAALIPQIVVKAGETSVNILAAGHRAGDAIVRCSELQGELHQAFMQVLKGNAEPLARVAPTSLVFGVWDSRDTQAKLPRIVSSTIRAYNIRKLMRSAQFVPATEFVANGLLDEPTDKSKSDLYAVRGFIHVPASGSHGGIQLIPEKGAIRRDATLNLASVRRLRAGDDKNTLALRRYIVGLSLVALTATQETDLRQGCNLVPAGAGSRTFELVQSNGERAKFELTHASAKKYAEAAAKAFGIGKSREVAFDKRLAEIDINGNAAKGKKTSKSKS